jgi:hypothetical protein
MSIAPTSLPACFPFVFADDPDHNTVMEEDPV